jgi:glycine/D-amino acid oxidase-like deaminating enzyme
MIGGDWEALATGISAGMGDYLSYWTKSARADGYPQLTQDADCDVVVIGGGIVGVTAALTLSEAGKRVALLEARHLGAGATGYTTAKLSSLHGLTYEKLASTYDDETARSYGEANEAGLEQVAGLVDQLGIDCDFRRKPNFTYTESEDGRSQVMEEAGAAKRLGLPAGFVGEAEELPFPVAGAVRFADQAEFHPLKYLNALAAAAADSGCAVYEQSRVVSVDQGSPTRVSTETGATVSAEHAIVATHVPFLDRGLYFARAHPERSYVLLARLRGSVPQGMYLSDESPAHSLRSVPTEEGELFMVGGESHKAGQSDAAERYEELESWARERFDVASIEHRWATQDWMPADNLPFIGRLWPFSSHVLTATGFRKWGLAMGTAAAGILADQVLGRENSWAATFSPMRLHPLAGGPEFVKENANAGMHFVLDRVTKRGNPRCTHMGCLLDLNRAEQTWDCPCHGSRFSLDGEVIEGPAIRPLDLSD